MRIAVIGGGLLGCATAADIAIVEEVDKNRGRSTEKHNVTMFCKEAELGGEDFRSVRVDNVYVETGRYRTLPKVLGSYLSDLVELANGDVNTISILGRRFRVPCGTRVRRGKVGAAPIEQLFAKGSYGRMIRSAVVWDFANDKYAPVHKGWSLLDILQRVLKNEIWRAVAVGGFLWTLRRLDATEGMLRRGIALISVFLMLVLVVVSPAGVVGLWQRTYSFWGTTIPQLITHGMTAGIARGGTEGFVKAMSENNTKNRATCAPSLGALLLRTGLGAYVRGSGEDYTGKFKYNASYVERYIAPHVDCEYAPAEFNSVNSLACQLAMYDADYSNSDAHTRICRVSPSNLAVCGALLDAARSTTPVEVCVSTTIKHIAYDESKCEYTLKTSTGAEHKFDGVVLAECPAPGELELDSVDDELFNYDVDVDVDVEQQSNNASHIAVVKGAASTSFFKYADEKFIPDVITVLGCEHFARVERVREQLYVVHCAADFVRDGVVAQMFEESHKVLTFERRAVRRYSASPVSLDKKLDDALPPFVLGNRFIYAAAIHAVASHPELDAMAAANAASLFSNAVSWETADNDPEEDEDDSDADEISAEN